MLHMAYAVIIICVIVVGFSAYVLGRLNPFHDTDAALVDCWIMRESCRMYMESDVPTDSQYKQEFNLCVEMLNESIGG